MSEKTQMYFGTLLPLISLKLYTAIRPDSNNSFILRYTLDDTGNFISERMSFTASSL